MTTALWNLLHLEAINYSKTPSDEEQWAKFYRIIGAVEENTPPGCFCRTTALTYILETNFIGDAIVEGREALEIYMVNFHNFVNRKLNKPEVSWTEYQEEVREELISGIRKPVSPPSDPSWLVKLERLATDYLKHLLDEEYERRRNV